MLVLLGNIGIVLNQILTISLYAFLLYDDLKERTITGQYGNSKTEISYPGMEHLHHFSFFQVSRIIMEYGAEGV